MGSIAQSIVGQEAKVRKVLIGHIDVLHGAGVARPLQNPLRKTERPAPHLLAGEFICLYCLTDAARMPLGSFFQMSSAFACDYREKTDFDPRLVMLPETTAYERPRRLRNPREVPA